MNDRGGGSALRSSTSAPCNAAPITTRPTNPHSTDERLVRRRARDLAPNGSASSSAAARELPSRGWGSVVSLMVVTAFPLASRPQTIPTLGLQDRAALHRLLAC